VALTALSLRFPRSRHGANGRERSDQQRAYRLFWRESRSLPASSDSISKLVRSQTGVPVIIRALPRRVSLTRH
jgi:hypothetical protein